MGKTKLPKPVNGMSLKWSAINQAYFLIWRGQVLKIIPNRAEAIAVFYRCIGGG